MVEPFEEIHLKLVMSWTCVNHWSWSFNEFDQVRSILSLLEIRQNWSWDVEGKCLVSGAHWVLAERPQLLAGAPWKMCLAGRFISRKDYGYVLQAHIGTLSFVSFVSCVLQIHGDFTKRELELLLGSEVHFANGRILFSNVSWLPFDACWLP